MVAGLVLIAGAGDPVDCSAMLTLPGARGGSTSRSGLEHCGGLAYGSYTAAYEVIPASTLCRTAPSTLYSSQTCCPWGHSTNPKLPLRTRLLLLLLPRAHVCYKQLDSNSWGGPGGGAQKHTG